MTTHICTSHACRHCGSDLALITQPGGDLNWQCQNILCGSAIHVTTLQHAARLKADALPYPEERYEIELVSGLYECRYGGETFDRALDYGDAHIQCGLHWVAQQALDMAPAAQWKRAA